MHHGRRHGRVRAVVQTVSRASVTVDGEVVGEITDGLLVLVGVTHTDTPATADAMARKVYELRILDDERSAADTGCTDPGCEPVHALRATSARAAARRWSAAAPAEIAEDLVTAVVEALRARGATVETGRFRAHMLVESVNVGPRTVIIDL